MKSELMRPDDQLQNHFQLLRPVAPRGCSAPDRRFALDAVAVCVQHFEVSERRSDCGHRLELIAERAENHQPLP